MPGMHGNATAITALQRSDLLITLGARFDDRITGKVSTFAPDAKVIHVDIDPAEQGKVRKPDVPIVGDCRLVIEEMVKAVRAEKNKREWPSLDDWHVQLRRWQEQFPLHYEQVEDGPLKPQFCIDMLRDNTPDDTIVASGVGQHQMWASQRWTFNHPYTWINSGGLGTMGFAVPAALGAKVGRPDERVVAIDGDGCFQMTSQELATSTTENIPIVVAILNNGHLGMVRQWQELFYNERYSGVRLTQDVPDYVRLAEAYGAIGLRAESPHEVDAVLDKALSVTDRSVVIDFRCDQGEMVFPMVPAGGSNDDIILGPEFAQPALDPAEAPIA
jgi:acetolactate synthase-1/2/3 large subunit